MKTGSRSESKQGRAEGADSKSEPKRDAHVYFDAETMTEIERLAAAEDRTVLATIRVLVREALASRKGRGGSRGGTGGGREGGGRSRS